MQNTNVNRVPAIVTLYWVIKIAATTLGETGADMFSMTYELGYGATILLFLSLFVLLLGIKIMRQRYEAILYWLVFTATTIVGTAISDYIDRTLQLGYTWGSLLLLALLLVILFFWWLKEKSINVEQIYTNSAEFYYWMAFLIANTLGTAAGDFLADELEIGFKTSALFISLVLLVIVGLHYLSRISGTLLFWLAFVLTRPFGATFGDWLTKPLDHGGLDLGTVYSSLFFGVILILAIAFEVRQTRQSQFLENKRV
ncbi:MAG: hypothetical protein KDK39_10085 [Leptospiraceae bacterium]|nr:hypothetical protein [Leptospiraceae bacterium]